MDITERIAQTIRRADGNHSLGAGAIAEAIVQDLNLRAEVVHVEGEWGFGARDDVRITGYLT